MEKVTWQLLLMHWNLLKMKSLWLIGRKYNYVNLFKCKLITISTINRLNPFIFLKRPIYGDLKWRLDQILKRKAVSVVAIIKYGST